MKKVHMGIRWDHFVLGLLCVFFICLQIDWFVLLLYRLYSTSRIRPLWNLVKSIDWGVAQVYSPPCFPMRIIHTAMHCDKGIMVPTSCRSFTEGGVAGSRALREWQCTNISRLAMARDIVCECWQSGCAGVGHASSERSSVTSFVSLVPVNLLCITPSVQSIVFGRNKKGLHHTVVNAAVKKWSICTVNHALI